MYKLLNKQTGCVHFSLDGFVVECRIMSSETKRKFKRVGDEYKVTCKKCLKALHFHYCYLKEEEAAVEYLNTNREQFDENIHSLIPGHICRQT